jgi:hypothetical protein
MKKEKREKHANHRVASCVGVRDHELITLIFSVIGGPGPVVPGLPHVGGKAPHLATAAAVSLHVGRVAVLGPCAPYWGQESAPVKRVLPRRC